MRALVVHESMFGNTAAVARAIADGLSSSGVEVEVVEAADAPAVPDDEVALLIVGGPTHAFGLSRSGTRAAAVGQGAPAPRPGPGLREWLAALPASRRALAAAAFDTHLDKAVPGSASRAAERRLRARGYRIVTPAESFHVRDVEGPLVDGERERAHGWGAALGAVLAPS